MLIAVPAAVVASSVLVVQASRAASTASLQTPSNGWQTGKVVLGADQTGSALFSATGIMPGDAGTPRCLRVDYTGNVAADVRLWVEASGTLAPSLQMTVEEGTGGSSADCTGFTPSGPPLRTASLATLAAQNHNPATGLGTWTPAGTPAGTESRTYRLTWSLPLGMGSANQTASATFHWNATQVDR